MRSCVTCATNITGRGKTMSLLERIKERNGQASVKEVTPMDYDQEVRAVVVDFNRREICLMDYPESTRHRAFVLEGQLTEAANKGDQERFLGLLNQWKGCFH